MSSKVQLFNEKLFRIWASDLDDVQDVKACFDALMMQYGVKYKAPIHLKSCFVEKCDAKYKGDVEAMFLDEINTVAHGKVFELMDQACNDFMDYSKAAWIKKPVLGWSGKVAEYLKQQLS